MNRKSTLQLPKGDEGPSECDSTNVSAQKLGSLGDVGCRVEVEVGTLGHKVGQASDDCSSPHQGVEEGHHLRQVCHLYALRCYCSN